MSSTPISVSWPNPIPLQEECDVLVVGGGPGGLGAAVAAARQGMRTTLVEQYGFLGGMATAGEVAPFMDNHFHGQPLDSGIFEQWLDRIGEYGGRLDNSRIFDPHAAALAAEDLCLEAGVRLLYHHRLAHVQTTGRRVDFVALHSKSGFTATKAKVYVDSTGDGDLAAMAGCEFEIGTGRSAHCQPMTLCFKVAVDPADLPAGQTAFSHLAGQWGEMNRRWDAAKAAGRVDCPREGVLIFPTVQRHVVHFNTTRVIHHDATDGRQLSQAQIQSRRQLRQILCWLKEEFPAFKRSRLYSMAPQIGVRESRRILGRAYVTRADYQAARTYPDAIARITYPIDIHNPEGSGTEIVFLPKNAWYEIPLGCLLPKAIDNLAIASRCISVDHAVHSSCRVMPPVCSFGQAAGTAAAMAIGQKVEVAQVDGVALRQELIRQGRFLQPMGQPQVDGQAADWHTHDQRPAGHAQRRARTYSA